jgi:hypothetical protein
MRLMEPCRQSRLRVLGVRVKAPVSRVGRATWPSNYARGRSVPPGCPLRAPRWDRRGSAHRPHFLQAFTELD